MKKKIFVVCLLISLALSSCSGVKQEEYDALVSENSELKAQIDELESKPLDEQASEALEDYHSTGLETMCKQLREGTTYSFLGEDTIMFLLPIDGEITADSIKEAADAVFDYSSAFALMYRITGKDKFIFRIQGANNEMILEICEDFTDGNSKTTSTVNYLYADEIRTAIG